MRHTLKVTLDKGEVKAALIAFALSKVDLGHEWQADWDVVVDQCDEDGATLVVRPAADLRRQNGEDQSL